MDRKIERKGIPLKKVIPLLVLFLLISYFVYQLINRTGTTRLKVDPSRIAASKVQYGEFLEYYPFDGTVIPVTSFYLEVEQGGKVEEIIAEGGKPIKKEDLILRLSNSSLQRNSIDTETRLLENLDTLRNTQFNRAQSKLLLRDNLLDLNYRILKLEKKYNRFKILKAEKIAISDEDYEIVEDELNYLIGKRELLKERVKQEDLLSEKQLAQANLSIERLNMSLDLLEKTVESLEVTAPISGHLSSISAEIGQTLNHGQRIGQIDVLDNLKIRANIDQYYISKVTTDTKGKFTLNGESYSVEVKKIYPEVVNSQFAVDMFFIGEPPEGIKRGQTLTIELSFSEPGRSLMVKKGGFYQQTGGRWVYKISNDGKAAYRRDIRLGRQNPRYVEVIEGLNEGDLIITSGYDTYGETDELVFKDAVDLSLQH